MEKYIEVFIKYWDDASVCEKNSFTKDCNECKSSNLCLAITDFLTKEGILIENESGEMVLNEENSIVDKYLYESDED